MLYTIPNRGSPAYQNCGIETELGATLPKEVFGVNADNAQLEIAPKVAMSNLKYALMRSAADRDLWHQKLISNRFGQSGSRVVLRNAGCFYDDQDHPEICTVPHTNALHTAVAYEATKRELFRLSMTCDPKISLVGNNYDPWSDDYFRQHENFQVTKHQIQEWKRLGGFIQNFLLMRVVFAGSGAWQPDSNVNSAGGRFILSPAINCAVGNGNRNEIYPLWREEDIPGQNGGRFHVYGDSNVLLCPTFLKMFITTLVIRGLADGSLSEFAKSYGDPALASPQNCHLLNGSIGNWTLDASGRRCDVVEFLYKLKEKLFVEYWRGADDVTKLGFAIFGDALRELSVMSGKWSADGLPKDDMSRAGNYFDWARQLSCIATFDRSRPVGEARPTAWHLASFSMAYHDLDPEVSLLTSREKIGVLEGWITEGMINRAMQQPLTRGAGTERRSWSNLLLHRGLRGAVSWEFLAGPNGAEYDISEADRDYRVSVPCPTPGSSGGGVQKYSNPASIEELLKSRNRLVADKGPAAKNNKKFLK